MPFSAVPAKNFKNRESEIAYLGRLAEPGEALAAQNVLLVGPRGMGKTELLKQLYLSLWDDDNVIPFYYCFQRATLKGAHFARDYFTRFVRQAIAFARKDPSLIDGMSIPLHRLASTIPGSSIGYLSELIEDFNEQVKEENLPGQVLAAVSAPLTLAERTGKRIVVLLDDFHLAAHVHETQPGDSPGVASLFENSMKALRCPHVLTGSPEDAMEAIFADDSFRGKAERLFLRSLPEDAAFSLFKDSCAGSGVSVNEECAPLMRHLGGNPLYIRNMARTLWRMQRKEATKGAFSECYAYEVSEGETAFYWSSILRGNLKDMHMKRLALELLMRLPDSVHEVRDLQRLSRVFGAPEASVRSVLDALQTSGIAPFTAGGTHRDTVFKDFVQASYMLEVEVREPEKVREVIMQRRFAPESAEATCFEMVIPMASEAELVAAKAVEQIGANMNLDKEEVGQLQLALIEACINAFEHSGSYEKKVFLKCSVLPGRLEINIESPGRAFDVESARKRAEGKPEGMPNRGMGLKLMDKFMDEVRVERIKDRTRIVLTKNIKSRRESNE